MVIFHLRKFAGDKGTTKLKLVFYTGEILVEEYYHTFPMVICTLAWKMTSFCRQSVNIIVLKIKLWLWLELGFGLELRFIGLGLVEIRFWSNVFSSKFSSSVSMSIKMFLKGLEFDAHLRLPFFLCTYMVKFSYNKTFNFAVRALSRINYRKFRTPLA